MKRSLVAFGLLGLVSSLSAFGCSTHESAREPSNDDAPSMKFGSGRVATEPPHGALVAIDAKGKRQEPKVADGFTGRVKTNGYWSSLVYQHDADNPFTSPIYAHPLAVKAKASGLGVSYPNRPTVAAREYMMRYDEDLRVGLAGLAAPRASLARYSDFAVTASLKDVDGGIEATFGHGLPFVYFERSGGRAAEVRIARAKRIEVFYEQGSTLGINVAGKPYALFAPGGTWKRTDNVFTSDLAGKAHFSIAVLPDASAATLERFAERAFAFIEDTSVTWQAEGSTVTTHYEAKTRLVEPCASNDAACKRTNEPLLALYRHQWVNSNASFEKGKYASPRGDMKLISGGSFDTKLTVSAILPQLPVAEDAKSDIAREVARVADGEHFRLGLGEKPAHDAYWEGKSLGRLATAAELADAVGEDDTRNELLDAMQKRLEDWFDGKAPRYFVYEPKWSSLIAFPDSYGSASQLNDHHFHYGYFVHAAATVARFRPDWAKAYGPMVDLLIRDVANPKSDDPLFPRLRHMDVYAGHSWASGPAFFEEGNNEESSSEDINFSYATALWGAATGNDELRQLGLYLYATQVSAVEEYWFDVDNAVFPEDFAHPTVAMVWGAGGKFDTWFDQDPTVIHAINYLPITAGSLYLGRKPEYVRSAFKSLLEQSKGDITTWRDYALMFAALGDPKLAYEHYERDTLFEPEFGNSRAMTVQFMTMLRDLGTPDFDVTADSPHAVVLGGENGRTYAAYNPSGSPRQVRFSDGVQLEVPAHGVKSRRVQGAPDSVARR